MQNYLIETYNILSWKDPWGLSSPTPDSKGQTKSDPSYLRVLQTLFDQPWAWGHSLGSLFQCLAVPGKSFRLVSSLSSPGQLSTSLVPPRDGEKHPAPPSAAPWRTHNVTYFPPRYCWPAIFMEGSVCQCLHWDLSKSGGQNKGCTAN